MSYVQVKLDLSPSQQKKLIKGDSVRIVKSNIGSGDVVYLHPLNAKKLNSCKKACNLQMSKGEIVFTARHHNPALGGNIFDSIWSGVKSVGKWLKNSGLGSVLADSAQTLAEPFVGKDVANVGRQIVKGVTGVGLKRPKKTKRISIMPSGGPSGGSFLIN